jgi:hypothetical protein
VLQIAYHFAQKAQCLEHQLQGSMENSKQAQEVAMNRIERQAFLIQQ